MSAGSAIEWTDHTWNPVTGCTKVSAGCKFCYAETFARRQMGPWRGRAFTDVRIHPERLAQVKRFKPGSRVFVNSMSDLFHEEIPFDFLAQVFRVMGEHPRVTFQVLTKRPGEMVDRVCGHLPVPPNVWLGVSVENQEQVDRVRLLEIVPCRVRFVSAEPLIGPLSLRGPLCAKSLDWVIVGGESGPHCRPMDPEWAVNLAIECTQSDVPFFMKQMGGYPNKRGKLTDLAVRRREFPR